MPRRDLLTGVDVMTMPEFIAHEAEREGITPDEYTARMYAEMEAANEAERQRLAQPQSALNVLKEASAFERQAGNDAPIPDGIVEVQEVQYEGTLRGEKMMLRARVVDEFGTMYDMTMRGSHDYGGYLDPPEHDESLEWVEVIEP